jgi:hypothetical protein
MSMITVASSDEDLLPVTVDSLIEAGVSHLVGWMQASGGLFITPRVADQHWLSTARTVTQVEEILGRPLSGARSVLDKVRADPWCRISVDWNDV